MYRRPSRLRAFFRHVFNVALLLGTVALMGLLTAGTATEAYHAHIARTQWQMTDSTIVATPALVDCYPGRRAREIRYGYTVADVEYTAQHATRCGKPGLLLWNLNRPNFAPGGFNQVYYNPAYPVQSRLYLGVWDEIFVSVRPLFLAAMTMGAAWLLTKYWRQMRSKERRLFRSGPGS